MSKRNFILLIIIILLALAAVLGYFYFNQNTTAPGSGNPGTNFISQFNPFGKSTTTPPVETPPADISGYEPGPTSNINTKLKKVSSMPVAGFTVFLKERLKDGILADAGKTKNSKPTPPLTEFMPALRYVDRATGNVYQTFVDKIEERRFSGTVIPKIYEAFFGNKGESVVMRYLKNDGKTIETFAGSLPKELLGGDTTGDNEVKGSFLPTDIKDLSLSPDASSFFYLFNLGDNTIGTIFNLTTNKKVQVFDSSFNEWLSSWPNSKVITLTTKPAAGIPGYMYVLNLGTKAFNKVLGAVNGLTTLTSPDGKLTLYGNDTMSLDVYNINTKVSDLLGVRTLPEKCVWGKMSDVVYCAVPKIISGEQYPDVWYQGTISFSDQIWKIDIKNGTATVLVDPVVAVGGEDIDGTKLMLDESEKYLFFVNKKDSFLWKLDLN